ncbi:MAG: MFS transporter [Clostridia bacterium]|nr:MFS transporter [Clostridia bacterium]
MEKQGQTARIEKSRNICGNFLIFACAFLYAASMAAKGIFIAEQQYIVDMWNLAYATASLSNTFYFVTYGFVQIVLFFIVSRLDIVKYVLVTVPIASLLTMLIGTAENIGSIWFYFGLSGAFQAGIYCGCNYALAKYLPVKLLEKANKVMNAMYALGTVAAYGLCALCITWGLWRAPYFVIGGIFASSVIVFGVAVRQAKRFLEINKRLDGASSAGLQNGVEEKPLFTLETRKKTTVFYILVVVFAFLISALYYGVMNYITALLVEVHGMSQNVSVYVSIIAPVAITLGPMLTIGSCEKEPDFIKVGLRYLVAILPIPVLLAFFYDSNVLLALVLSVLFVVVAQGVKTIVLSVITFRMRNQLNVGAYSAISNAVASVSGGVIPTVFGKIIDTAGWTVSYVTLFGLTAIVLFSLFIIDALVCRAQKKEAVL